MTILVFCIGAALGVLSGAVVAGVLGLPARPAKGGAPSETPEDALSRDLAALMAYGREEDDHAV